MSDGRTYQPNAPIQSVPKRHPVNGLRQRGARPQAHAVNHALSDLARGEACREIKQFDRKDVPSNPGKTCFLDTYLEIPAQAVLIEQPIRRLQRRRECRHIGSRQNMGEPAPCPCGGHVIHTFLHGGFRRSAPSWAGPVQTFFIMRQSCRSDHSRSKRGQNQHIINGCRKDLLNVFCANYFFIKFTMSRGLALHRCMLRSSLSSSRNKVQRLPARVCSRQHRNRQETMPAIAGLAMHNLHS